MLYPVDVLDASAHRDVVDWARHAGFALVDALGPEHDPHLHGISLGRLNLDWIQGKLADFGLLVGAATAAVTREHTDRCTIISGYRPAARSVRDQLAPMVRRVTAYAPPRMRGPTSAPTSSPTAFKTSLPDATELLGGARDPRSRVLLVSDGVAMAAMFERVEQEIERAGIGPVLRVQYGSAGPATRSPKGGVTIAQLARVTADPGDVLASRARWGPAEVALRTIERAGRLPGADRYSAPYAEFVEDAWLSMFPLQAERVRQAVAIIDATAPELVVVGNDRWWGHQAFVLVARARGIPTLCLQDGIDGVVPSWYWLESDCIATMGDTLPERLAHGGFSPERWRVTGQPRFDTFAPPTDPDARRAARERLGLDADAFWVMFAGQPGQDPSFLRRMVSATLAAGNVRLFVRPHPSTDPATYAALIAAHPPGRIVLPSVASMLDSLVAADMLLTQHSNVAIEAAMVDRPVVTTNFTGVPDITPFVECGIATPARDGKQLTALVARVLRGDRLIDRARVLAGVRRLVGPPDGNAGARVAEFIAELLDAGRTGAFAGARTGGLAEVDRDAAAR